MAAYLRGAPDPYAGKERFGTASQANTAVSRKHREITVGPYHCDRCRCWHIGRAMPRLPSPARSHRGQGRLQTT
jgi:hypothetical protein